MSLFLTKSIERIAADARTGDAPTLRPVLGPWNLIALGIGAGILVQAMEQRLDSGRFVRVRRTAIVNLERIAALQPWERDEHVLVLKNGVRIGVGPSYRSALEARLGAGWG